MTQWNEKDVLKHAQELKSPFENVNQNGNLTLQQVMDEAQRRGLSRTPQVRGQV